MTNNDEALNNLARKALKQIRTLCRGNGAEPDSVQIRNFAGEMITVEALNHIELHPDISEEKRTGKLSIGTLVEGPPQIQEAINQITVGGIKNQEIRKVLSATLLERDDKGFARHAEYFEIAPLNQTFSYYEPCGTCQGHGQVGCNRCGGRGQEVCNQCHGRTMIPCNTCHSSGFTQGPDGKQQQCNKCFGQRQIPCGLCRKTGVISCRQCKGGGAVKCSRCKGGAFDTQIVYLKIKLKTLFEIDRTQIPDPATQIIQEQGPAMVEKGHIKVRGEPVKREDGGLAIQYQALFPYGDLELTINGKPLKTYVFGYKGKLLRLPNFIETLIDSNYHLLQLAGKGEGAVDSKIRKATHSRIIANGLIYALTMPSKKAVLALKKKYPMGISNDTLKSIIILSNKALAHVTRKTRFGGMAMGVVGAALIDAAYFIGPLRLLAMQHLSENIIMGIDILLIPIGGIIGVTASKFMAQRPLKKALGKLLDNQTNSKFKPRTKNSVLPNYLASIVIFLLIIYLAKMLEHPIPSWFPL